MSRPSVDLYWLPLGAGGHSVRLNGRIFEAVVARLEKRPSKDLYHSALVVRAPEGEFVIEQAPVRDGAAVTRGVVAGGAVGSRWARSLRIFRYEIRCWRDGVIPDVGEAVDSPQRLTDDPAIAQHILELVPDVPTPVWGRDELQTGEMWNSNSVISWLIARSGLVVETVHPPAGGRAPGWRAGLVVARRQEARPESFKRDRLTDVVAGSPSKTIATVVGPHAEGVARWEGLASPDEVPAFADSPQLNSAPDRMPCNWPHKRMEGVRQTSPDERRPR